MNEQQAERAVAALERIADSLRRITRITVARQATRVADRQARDERREQRKKKRGG
jgi:hypothetical protein